MYIPDEGLISQSEFISYLCSTKFEKVRKQKNKSTFWYYNVPAAFDIESSSFYADGVIAPENKRAIMYVWQFGIYNKVTYGRTWEEFSRLMSAVSAILELNENTRLIVYIHNLGYEFQFIRKRFLWNEVFSLEDRKPVTARFDGVEFRCSQKLSGGKSLETVGKDLIKYPVQKLVGSLDYERIRTPITPLWYWELRYCENDIRVLLHYIQEKIEQDGNISKIPLTNTGYVRNKCRKNCYERWHKYRPIIESLTISPDEFSQLLRAFAGGYTHANGKWVRKVLSNVGSYDFTSSYPAVMVLEKFPMSSATVLNRPISRDEFDELLHTKCCLFDIELNNVVTRYMKNFAHPLSSSKCSELKNYVLDNGRIVMAEHLKTTVTEQDFFVLLEFYEWDDFSISNFRYYEKGYLPTVFVKTILQFYKDKTKLKGVDDMILEYMISKNMVNACYGMIVTNPVRDEILYSNERASFEKEKANLVDAINKYNEDKKRFLFYPWGVWVTSYARANLFSAILACEDDTVYCDTDSIKLLNSDKHRGYFERYNKGIMDKIELAKREHGLTDEDFSPMTINGEKKTIGVWDYEGTYSQFKTLGAKRYIVKKETADGPKWEATIAGSNKKKTMAWLLKTGDPFKNFTNNMVVPPDSSGRLTLTYIDREYSGTVTDYLGQSYEYNEKSAVHMEKSEYTLTMADEFIRYLKGEICIE